jgi:ribosomal protein S14
MKLLYTKDKNRRNLFLKLEKKRIVLNYIINNLTLSSEIRYFAYLRLRNLSNISTITKIKNRCVFSNRARSIYRKFKLSRIFLKKYALEGDIMGIKKSS